MSVRWFKHGQWPKFLVGLHYYTIVSFVLLVVTGVALYAPSVHIILIPYLSMIYKVHILFGLIFGVSVLAPFLRLLPKGKTIWRLDWMFPLLFGTAIVLTGILLWGVTLFPTIWRSPAFTWHGVFTAILGGWLIVHAFLKTFGLRPPREAWVGKVDPERRLFLKWIGSGIAGAAVFTIIDPFSTISQLLSSTPKGVSSSSRRFVEYYTVTNGYPEMSLTDYQLKIDGDVEKPLALSWAQVKQLQPYSETIDFHCVTGWSVPNVKWDGVHVSELLKLVQPHQNVQYVNFYSFDGAYSESLRLSEALDPSVVLAYTLDGQPLIREQGFPLRLVVPKMYGYKSLKWLARVEFSSKPIAGFWEQRGYPSEAYFA